MLRGSYQFESLEIVEVKGGKYVKEYIWPDRETDPEQQILSASALHRPLTACNTTLVGNSAHQSRDRAGDICELGPVLSTTA
jgi:hypothetical protein